MKLLSDYYRVPQNPITERMELRKRVQQPGESVSNYVVELKRMSRYCEYGTDLESNLRDTFSAGVRDPNVKQKLLLKMDLTCKDAHEIAISYESSKREADQVTEKSMQDVNWISRQVQGRGSGGGGSWNGGGNRGGKKTLTQKKTVQQQQCGRCLCAHCADKCPYKKAKCYGCQRVGHIHRVCRSTTTVKHSQNSRPSKSDKKTHLVSMDQEIADLEENLDLTTLFSLENDNESHGNDKESRESDNEFRDCERGRSSCYFRHWHWRFHLDNLWDYLLYILTWSKAATYQCCFTFLLGWCNSCCGGNIHIDWIWRP